MNTRRLVWSATGVAIAAALVGGGWVAANAFTSPAQWEAQAAAPKPSPILAEVTKGDLVDERTLPATVVPESGASVPVAPVEGATRSIVTESSLAAGAAVKVGTVLVRVNGDPVLALASPFPFYRDLGVGDTGPDVTVLQQNLKTLGLLASADGSFGPATARAVAGLYRAAHATAPTRADPAPTDATSTSDDPGTASGGTEGATPSRSAYLPLSAVVAVPILPARVANAPQVGADVAAGAAVRLTSDGALLRVNVPAELSHALTQGSELQCAVADEPAGPCRVLRVFEATADAAGIGTGDQKMSWADVVPVGDSIDPAHTGQPGSVGFRVATLAEHALLVPATAVAQQSKMSGIVLRKEPDGSFAEVRVAVVAVLKGRMAVTGDLTPGDQVRVG
jgi:peptidoglycan hydrolase-like protein with peptidoglycan-binding domain